MAEQNEAPVYNIAETNLALWGSDVQQRVREHAGDTESAWEGVGQQEGLLIWRIEEFKVVPWPEERRGQFYDGDSYIILYTYKKNTDSETLAHDLHFWLGSHTTQDEAGTAAYKTVELDDRGVPVQYRECQSFESSRFRSHFPNGIRVLSGGVRSGFTHPEPDAPRPPKLFQISAHLVAEVRLPITHLEDGDVYVYDTGGEANSPPSIMQYNSKGSTGIERFKGAEIAREMAGDLGEVQVYACINQNFKSKDGDAVASFFHHLNLPYPPEIPPEVPSNTLSKTALLRVQPSSSPPYSTLDEVTKEALDPSDIFILATAKTVFVWHGSKTSSEEKRAAMGAAQRFIADSKMRPETNIVRVLQGQEAENFWTAFEG
ncbi:actin regulatory protein [Ceratobasidium sp. AG-Ba]|nr:actin regulatory protein [Ceratobasidium sp. AG-Ba]